jgi:hypothetical protein
MNREGRIEMAIYDGGRVFEFSVQQKGIYEIMAQAANYQ